MGTRSRTIGTFAAIAVAMTALTGCASGAAGSATARIPAAAASAAPAPAPTVVTIGDSIMKGYGLTPEQAWPELLAAQDGWQLDNLACNGAGFLAVGDTGDCDATFAGLVSKAAALHPQTVIVEGSSNDFGQDDTDLLGETVSQVRQLRAALPGAQIIGLSTVWGDTAAPAQLADVDTQVQTAVTQVGGTFVEIGQPLSGHPEWMQSDDVHPTADGQVVLSGAVESALRQAGVKL